MREKRRGKKRKRKQEGKIRSTREGKEQQQKSAQYLGLIFSYAKYYFNLSSSLDSFAKL
jgi:hypothetical protein